MEVQIISKEIIKPSVPTPPSLRTYKLCILDQITADCYSPIVTFYSSLCADSKKTSNFLKESLSKALTSFYPLAGRIRNDLSCVHCNDDGATFIEARVDVDLSASLELQDTIGLQQLLPCKPYDKASETVEQVLLAIQINYFKCGGIAVGACMWHEIGDGSSLGSFLNVWGEIARTSVIDQNNNKIIIDGAIVDCTSLFPPLNSNVTRQMKTPSVGDVPANINGKRFVINGQKLAKLKQEIGSETTSFEALSTLIWAAIATVEDKNVVYLVFPMNIRKILEPSLPEHCLGNFIHAPIVEWPHLPNKNGTNYKGLAQAIRAAKRMTNNEYIRRCHDIKGGYLNFLTDRSKEQRRLGISKFLAITSLCESPFYDADFGWGKPISVLPAIGRDFTCFIVDTRDEEGMEVWIGLSKENMEKFVQDPGIITYTSFSSDILHARL